MVRHRFSLPFRFLFASVLLGGLTLLPAFAAESTADPGIEPQTQIVRAGRVLDDIRRSLEDADAAETLKTLSEKALTAQRDAGTAARALEPRLQQIDERIAQLGTPSEGSTEGRDISQQRQMLATQRSELDSAIKRGNLLALEAKQLGESIEKVRAQQFEAQLARKVASPLSLSLWQQLAEHVPADYTRWLALYRQGQSAFRTAIATSGWTTPLVALALALLLMFPVRLWLRHAGRRYAASERAPAGRLRRSGLAVWSLLVGTVLPGMASLVLMEGLRLINAIPPRLQSAADVFVAAAFVAAFIAALSACLLVPKRSSWRLLNIDDIAATRLGKYAWGAAGLTWLSMMLREINRAARTSEVTTVALDGVIALTYVILIIAILLSLARLHHRKAGQPQEAKGTPANGWLVLARLGGSLTVLAALVATLLGYLNFAMFTAQQMVWITVVFMAVSLLLKFADDFALWLLAPDGATGRTLRLSTGLSTSRVEQGAVLLSAVFRIGLILLGLTALTAPLGNFNALNGWMDTLSNGLTIGGAVLKPAAVVRGIIVLVVGLG